MRRYTLPFFFIYIFCSVIFSSSAQLKWVNVDSLFQPLPPSVHIFKTNDSLDGKPNIAYYAEADLKDKNLEFTADTTFFSFETNQNLNVVIKDGNLVSYNIHSITGRGKDTFTYRHPFCSAIGISKRRKADIAWLYADSSEKFSHAMQLPIDAIKDSVSNHNLDYYLYATSIVSHYSSYQSLRKWKMKTAVGGGPVLLQDGEIKITNNEELKFAGSAIEDKHPRTSMGYTKDDKLIILVIQGRFSGIAEGATLIQEAQIFKDLGCVEALNLDGGGSSCMLVNGKETIKPSDKEGQRPVPAVFIIKSKR